MPMGACTLKAPESRVLVNPALKNYIKFKAGILSSASGTNFRLSCGSGYGHELSISHYKKYIYVDYFLFFPPSMCTYTLARAMHFVIISPCVTTQG